MSQLQQRLTLKGQLYNQPETDVNKAIQIIEQLKSTTRKEGGGEGGRGGGRKGLRSLLVTVGQLLAADCFNLGTLHDTDDNSISSDPGKRKIFVDT